MRVMQGICLVSWAFCVFVMVVNPGDSMLFRALNVLGITVHPLLFAWIGRVGRRQREIQRFLPFMMVDTFMMMIVRVMEFDEERVHRLVGDVLRMGRAYVMNSSPQMEFWTRRVARQVAGDMHTNLRPGVSLADAMIAFWKQWSGRTTLPESIEELLREVANEQ